MPERADFSRELNKPLLAAHMPDAIGLDRTVKEPSWACPSVGSPPPDAFREGTAVGGRSESVLFNSGEKSALSPT
ncbi:MAG: hypothetical protein U9O18_07935, partial [Chloroflexota bacterium]|nr:hypothetical protein [Chloroflexota bacterium]